MMQTPHYRIPFFSQGDRYSAAQDKIRMLIAENQFAALAATIGDGVLSGWTVTHSGTDEISISPGSGFINGVYHRTHSTKKATVVDGVSTSIYLQSRMFPLTGGLDLEMEGPASEKASGTFVDTTPPAQPTGFQVLSQTFESISLEWNAYSNTPDFSHFEIERKTGANPFQIVALRSSNGTALHPYVDSGLEESTTYAYRLYGVDNSGNRSTYASLTQSTDADTRQPSEPTNFKVVPGNTMISAYWGYSQTTNAKYKLTVVGFDNDGNIASTDTYDDIESRFYQLTSLQNGIRYRLTLQSKRGTVLSSGLIVETTCSATPAPKDVLINPATAVLAKPGAVELSWLGNPDVDTGTEPGQKREYRIYVLSKGAESVPMPVGLALNKTVANYTLNGIQYMQDHVDYVFRITTLDAFGNESAGVFLVGNTQDVTPPKNPRYLVLTPDDETVFATWRHSTSSDVASYVVSIDSGTPVDIGYVTKYTFTGLTNGQEVLIRVQAKDGSGNTSNGIADVVTPLADAVAPAVPSGVSVRPQDREVLLAWTPNTEVDFSNYNVKRMAVTQTVNAPPGTILTEKTGTHPSLGTTTFSANDTEVLDSQLLNGQVYAYYIKAIDLHGNESEYSAPVLVMPRTGLNDIEPPTDLTATFSSSPARIELAWSFIDSDATAFNVYRSTDSITGFELIASKDATDFDSQEPSGGGTLSHYSYYDENLINGTTYTYFITAVKEVVEVITEAGTVQPPNALLLATVEITEPAASITAEAAIASNLSTTLSRETLDRLLKHKHNAIAENPVSVTALRVLSLVDATLLANTDFSQYPFSPETANAYRALPKGTDVRTMYVIAPASIVWNAPFIGDFQVLIDGEIPTIEYTIDHDNNAIVFATQVPSGSVPSLNGMGFSYYVPSKMNLSTQGFGIYVDNVLTEAFADDVIQTVRLNSAVSSTSITTLKIEPQVPSYGVQESARPINLNRSSVLSDFTTKNGVTYVSESGDFAESDKIFVLVNGERTTKPYTIDYTEKSVTFDDSLSSADTVAFEILDKDEVENELPQGRLTGLDASQFKLGTFIKPQLPSLSHIGRYQEPALPSFSTLSSTDKFVFSAPSGTLGSGCTPYTAYIAPSGDILLGTSSGILKAVGFAALMNEGGSLETVVDYTTKPPSGIRFETADVDALLNSTANAEFTSGRFNGRVTIQTLVAGFPKKLKEVISPNLTLLDDGKVLISGGCLFNDVHGTYVETTECWIYDPDTTVMTATGNLSVARSSHASIRLPSGDVLICGGSYSAYSNYGPDGTPQITDIIRINSIEIFNSIAHTWSVGTAMTTARDVHSLMLLNDNTLLVAGGNTGTSSFNGLYSPPHVTPPVPLKTAEVYNIGSGSWSAAAVMSRTRASATSKVVSGCGIVTGGGQTGKESYYPDSNTWVLEDGSTESNANSSQNSFPPSSINFPTKQFFQDASGNIFAVAHKDIYISTDLGVTFVKTKGLEAVGVVHRITQASSGTLLAATDLGVYEIVPDLYSQMTWFQTELIGLGTTETFDLQVVGADVYAATEIGVFKYVANSPWVQKFDTEDVYNLELAGDVLYAQCGSDLYKSTASSSYGTWVKVPTSIPYLDQDTKLLARSPLDLFFATKYGLYVTRDETNFILVNFNRNRQEDNNASMLNLIGTDVLVGFDNQVYAVDPDLKANLLAEFSGSIPTVLVDGTEQRGGFAYDTRNSQVCFYTKRLVDDTVMATSNYSTVTLRYGGWATQRPNAAVLVYVNGKIESDDGFTKDPFLGKFVFTRVLKKTEHVTATVVGTTLKNSGEFFHDELEDRFGRAIGFPLDLQRQHACLTLQNALDLESAWSSGATYLANTECYIMGRRAFDEFNSTINYAEESVQPYIGFQSLIPLSALEVASKLYIGTENGVFVSDPNATVPFSIVDTIQPESYAVAVRDIKLLLSVLYLATSNGLYSSTNNVTFTRNPGLGLPSSLNAITNSGTDLIAATDQGIYYSVGYNQDNSYETWSQAYIVNGTSQSPFQERCVAIAKGTGAIYAATERGIYLTGDGRSWSLAYTFANTVSISCLCSFSEKLFVGTNVGIYNDQGSVRAGSTAFFLEEVNNDPSSFAVNALGTFENAMYAVGNTPEVYKLLNETWSSTTISDATSIQKFIILSDTRQVAMENDSIFVQ